MPLSMMIFIVSLLMVIGIISLTDALIRLLLHKKTAPESVVLWICSSPEAIEHTVKKIKRKYPCSRIIISNSLHSDETEKILDILKKDYPNLSVR